MTAAGLAHAFSIALVPLLLLAILALAAIRRVDAFAVFVVGAKGGFEVAVRIIPYLVALLVAIGMFRASGAMDAVARVLRPATDALGLPFDVLPVALMRPLSGSGTLALVTDVMKAHGADSFAGRLASTIYGSTETTFYVLAVYFGSVGIRRTRHAVAAGLVGDVTGILAALLFCRLLF